MAANISNKDAFNEAFNDAFKPSFFLTTKPKEFAKHVSSNEMQIDADYINRLYNDWYNKLDVKLKNRNITTAREVFINKFTTFLGKYITGTLKKQINIKDLSNRFYDVIPVKINPLKTTNTNAYAGLSESNARQRKRVVNAAAAKGGRRRHTKKKLTKKNRSRKSK